MISLKSKRELQIMQKSANIIREIFTEVQPAVKVGATTNDLDKIAEGIIEKRGGKPAFKGYRGFPKVACISVNEEVVHGIPSDRVIKESDIVSFDIGVIVEGYYADSARTWAVGKVSAQQQLLIDAPKKALEAGLAAYKPGCRIGDLSAEIQHYIEKQGFQVVRDYVGHGIGRDLHEDPQVPNYGSKGRGPKIEEGLVLAIEPMVTQGNYAVETLEDGWTVVTKDRKLATHHEDDIAFTEDGFINLTGGESSSS